MSFKTLSQLQKILKDQHASWSAGYSDILSLSSEDFESLLGYNPSGEDPNEPTLLNRELVATQNYQNWLGGSLRIANIPDSVDLRSINGESFITPVRNQYYCGSCVAFGTVSCIEGTIRVQKNISNNNPDSRKYPDLSEAHLFYCGAGKKCTVGWNALSALRFCKDNGITIEANMPYLCEPNNPNDPHNYDLACLYNNSMQLTLTQLASFQTLSTPDEMKAWLANKGPLISGFTVYSDFKSYASGVYRKRFLSVRKGGHCICIIGYDDIAQCWIAKNSWGDDWGENGFFRIGYGECGIDATMYGVDQFASVYLLP